MTRRRRPRRKWRSLYLWHRYVGLTAALFVLVLAGTGLLLNHTTELRLAERSVGADWLLDWYGIEAPAQTPAYRAGEHWVSQWGEQRLYLDQRRLDAPAQPLIGAADLGEFLVVALAEKLLLLTPNGQLVEAMGQVEGVPAGMRRVGTVDERLAVETREASYAADGDLLRWRRVGAETVSWSRPAALPDTLERELAERYRGGGLPLERVVLDLHSGRFLGTAGVVLMDAAAVLMGFLAVTGAWMWLRQLVRRRARK